MKHSPAQILEALVRTPSVSSMSNVSVVELAMQILHAAGWQMRPFRYQDANGIEKINLLAMPSSQNLDNPVVDFAFVCHTDTVPYGGAWAHATEPIVHDGFLYGCGACDVKGFLACILSACTSVAIDQIASKVCVVLTADEEIGCIGAARIAESGAIRPKRAIIGEPTSLHPARVGKGYCLAEIRVHGKEAHSAHPAHGHSAIYDAARLIALIEQYGKELQLEQHPFLDPAYTTLNVGRIEGGTAKNIVPADCQFLLEWRPIPGQPATKIPEALDRIIRDLRDEDPTFHCTVNILRQQEGFDTAADSPLVQTLCALTGLSAVAIPFSTEAPFFAKIAGEVVVLGAGDMRTAHSERECVSLQELDACTACLIHLLKHAIS